MPGVSTKALRDAARSMADLAEGIRKTAGSSVRFGVAIPARRGEAMCRVDEGLSRAQACLSRLTGITPLADGALEAAVGQASELIRTAPSPYPRPVLREVIVLVAVYEGRTPDRGTRDAYERECAAAQRSAKVVKERGILVLTTGEPSSRAGDVVLERCLRYLATSRRYHFESLRDAVRVFEPIRTQSSSSHPRVWDLTITMPEYIYIDAANASDARATVQGNVVRLSGWTSGARMDLNLRAALPGYQPLTDEVLLRWQEVYGLEYSERRSPLGRVLVLVPRRVATATPAVQEVRR
jgi:hypothetical protein